MNQRSATTLVLCETDEVIERHSEQSMISLISFHLVDQTETRKTSWLQKNKHKVTGKLRLGRSSGSAEQTAANRSALETSVFYLFVFNVEQHPDTTSPGRFSSSPNSLVTSSFICLPSYVFQLPTHWNRHARRQLGSAFCNCVKSASSCSFTSFKRWLVRNTAVLARIGSIRGSPCTSGYPPW